MALRAIDHHGLTAINHAFICGDNKIIGILLGLKLSASYDSVADHFSKQGKFYTFSKEIAFSLSVPKNCTPSLACVAEANEKLFPELINSNLDINATTTEGWSQLHFAVESGDAELVHLLIESGARVDLVTSLGISPLHIASARNNRKVIQRLLDAGASLKATDKEGSTPLHYAMTMDKFFTAQMLIEKGSDILAKNHLGMSPLSIMAALAHIQSNSKDELQVSIMQKLMFAGIAASCLAGYFEGNLILDIIALAATAVPIAITINNTKSFAGKVVLAGTLALSSLPGFNVASQIWRTYVVGQECMKGLKSAWNNRHIETARPIRNAVIYGTNAAFLGNKFLDSILYAFDEITILATTIFEERSNSLGLSNSTVKYAFKRDITLDRDVQNLDKAKLVFNELKNNHKQTNVDFNETILNSYDHEGTCSAMALDFVARMNSECTKLVNATKFQNCVTDQEPIYSANNPGFASVQSAFNAINVVDETFQVPLDVIKAQKMQALASYHDMTLTPVSRPLYRGEDVGKLIEKLPVGSYVVRLLFPMGNRKLEHYGHTMGFIKREDLSIFYDNSKGARIIEENVTANVLQHLDAWPAIPMITIYKAECPSQGCSNLADCPPPWRTFRW
ncbi:MAG TPA: ankyrin repeat domain-containing protein [Parachlamydiaceae bacterium]|nr:ankyrin repeat domain-containing protein [Parachlamydiaceae bacterium]